MPSLAAIKVKITLTDSGNAKYPAFNTLPTVQATGIDWAQYLDKEGTGWHYDCCGHKEEDAESPYGEQYGLLLVPVAFADEAVAAFPAEVTRLTEVQAKDFFDRRHARDIPEEEIDGDVLENIKRKQDLNIPLNKQEKRALDPRDSSVPGIRENWMKKLDNLKARKNITIIEP